MREYWAQIMVKPPFKIEFNYRYIVVMSDTSIHFKDEGYTSPDFLTNLFKKPLYSSFSMSSFEPHPQSQKQLYSSSTKQNNVPLVALEKRSSSPLKFKNQTSNTSKTYKSTPTIDEEKISSTKYKIFIKTLLQGVMQEDELNGLWNKLEDSLKNPFLFDRFIDEIKQRKEKQAQIKQEKEAAIRVKEVATKITSKTPEKVNNKQEVKCPNTDFKLKQNQDQNNAKQPIKESIRKDIVQIRKQLLKGQKIIRQK